MAVGISPKYKQEISLEGLTQEEALVIALEAIGKEGWDAGYTSEKGIVAYTGFSMRSYGETIKVTFSDQNIIIKSECMGTQFFDWGKNKRNVNDFIEAFSKEKSSLTKEELTEKINEIKLHFSNPNEDVLIHEPLNTKESTSGFFAIFKPTKDFFVTPIIINVNLIVFIIMVIYGVNAFLPTSEDLLAWGANFRPTTLAGQWWRLITCCFLHIGIFHLLFNMYALLYVGVLLEPILGRNRFFAAYMVTGIAASLTSLAWNEFTISAGASGAIFGMYGVFLAMLTTKLIEKSARKTLLTSTIFFIGYNLLNGAKGGIDNAAHVGGLLSGLVVGYALYPSLKLGSKKWENISVASISVAIFIAIIIICKTTSNDLGTYDMKMAEFATLEEKALAVYSLPEGTSDKKVLEQINGPGMESWNKCKTIVKELNELDLPDVLYDRNKLLWRYCELRVESYKLLNKAVSEKTDKYQAQIDSCISLINQVVAGLSAK